MRVQTQTCTRHHKTTVFVLGRRCLRHQFTKNHEPVMHDGTTRKVGEVDELLCCWVEPNPNPKTNEIEMRCEMQSQQKKQSSSVFRFLSSPDCGFYSSIQWPGVVYVLHAFRIEYDGETQKKKRNESLRSFFDTVNWKWDAERVYRQGWRWVAVERKQKTCGKIKLI